MKNPQQLTDKQRSKWIAEKHERSRYVETRAVDEEKRTVEVAFSSEDAYLRWFGYEILDHGPTGVRLGRLNNGGAVLVDHDTTDHVGVIESARIDDDGVGRAVWRFGKSARASEVFQDVVDGIRSLVSVGYMVHDMVLESKGGDDTPPTYRVTDWEPLENSLVAVPADATVGVGRNLNENEDITMKTDEQIRAESKEAAERAGADRKTADDAASKAAADKKAADKKERERIEEQVRAAESKRRSEIDLVVKKFPYLKEKAEAAIADGISADEFNRQAIEAINARTEASPANYGGRVGGMTMPRRAGKLKAFKQDDHGLEQAYRAGMWARAVLMGDESAARWCRDYDIRVMTGTSSSTSSIVPDEMIQPIIDLRETYGVARQRCRIVPMGSDTATVPRRVSGVTAYFPGRNEATTESDAAFDDVNLVAREVSSLTRIAKSYAQDAVIDLGDHLASEMAYAFAVKEDDCLFNGDGTSTYGGIYGIRPKIIDGNHTAGAIDAASGIDTLAEITADDLVTCSGALPEFPGIMPVWYTSKRGNALVFDALKAAGGGNTIQDLGSRPSMTWLGDEIGISQSMPKVTTDLSNVAMLVYGDLDMGVTFGDRQSFEVDVLTERYAEYRQIGVIATERMDIVVHGLGDTSNAGPIVALIGE